MAIIPFYKRYGETLNYMLERFRTEQTEYSKSKITYAGRLDPMAEGLMILLTDDDVHKKDEFLSLDKTYEVEFILGFETDSYDILGKITHSKDSIIFNVDTVQEYFENITGKIRQPYPPYSSYRVNGKPLWQWSRDELINTIEIPSKEVTIHDAQYLGFNSFSESELLTKIEGALSFVKGDFRQEEIIYDWQKKITKQGDGYIVFCAELKVSSGTYIRSIIHALGQELNTGATCLKITRKKVGKYTFSDIH